MTEHHIEGVDVLITSIVVLFVGMFLTQRVPFLKRNNIPDAVAGGLICSVVVGLVYAFADVKITFDMRIRDVLLLVFFSTIGLTAKLRLLRAGGKALAILIVVSAVFLVLQDVTGVLLALLVGAHPGYGLFGGSVSFAGGYGTAIAWGEVSEQAGLAQAQAVGVAFATFGLIAGGTIGGPIARRLIERNKLTGPTHSEPTEPSAPEATTTAPGLKGILDTVLALAVCVELGDVVNRYVFSAGMTVPGFLTAMAVGILITNLADVVGGQVNKTAVDRAGEISLQVFLSMSLMSMQLWTLAQAAGPMFLVLAAQVLAMTAFAIYIVFRVMGRDYDASVIAAGFAGLGLGATPVAVANMNAITAKYGPSPKAFLIVPLVGAFFIDILNAIVIKFFLALPIMQQSAS